MDAQERDELIEANHLLGHLITLRAIHDVPDDPKIQEQWSGRLQGMAMRGYVWRFPDKPWQPSEYGRRIIVASATHSRIVAAFGPLAAGGSGNGTTTP